MAGAPRSSTPDSLATQFAAAQLAGDAAARRRSGRSGAERKEWSAAEDDTIRSAVALHGCKWRKIAAMLPGRSDDAVQPVEPAEPRGRRRGGRRRRRHAGAGAAAPRAPPSADGSTHKPERISWTRAEDATIVQSVAELGHKWYLIAQRLPGRTDHAIRNRYHRLQSTMIDDNFTALGALAAPSRWRSPVDAPLGVRSTGLTITPLPPPSRPLHPHILKLSLCPPLVLVCLPLPPPALHAIRTVHVRAAVMYSGVLSNSKCRLTLPSRLGTTTLRLASSPAWWRRIAWSRRRTRTGSRGRRRG